MPVYIFESVCCLNGKQWLYIAGCKQVFNLKIRLSFKEKQLRNILCVYCLCKKYVCYVVNGALQLIPITKLIRKKLPNLYVFFSCRWGATHRKIDDLSICPPNIHLDLFCLLVIPYSWVLYIFRDCVSR